MTTVGNTAYTNFPAANYIWSPRTDIFANGDGYFMWVGCLLSHVDWRDSVGCLVVWAGVTACSGVY